MEAADVFSVISYETSGMVFTGTHYGEVSEFKVRTENRDSTLIKICQITVGSDKILIRVVINGILAAHSARENNSGAHMTQKAAPDSERFLHAALQFIREIVMVKIVELFQIPENAAPLAPEVLRDVCSLQLGKVVFSDVTQSFDILPLCGQELLQDLQDFPVPREGNEKCKFTDFIKLRFSLAMHIT